MNKVKLRKNIKSILRQILYTYGEKINMMNVHSNDQSLGNSRIGDNCNRSNEGLVHNGMITVEMEKSLIGIFKGVKGFGVLSASFLRMLMTAMTENLN